MSYHKITAVINGSNSVQSSCFQAGECRDSLYIEGELLSDEFSCLDLCNSDEQCNWFTFFPQLGFCQLFKECTTLDSEACPDCLSGERNCVPPEPVCWVRGECEGTIDRVDEVETLEECLDLCKQSTTCRWFTFYEPSSPCILMKDCTTIDESCTSCISGEKRCQGDVPKGIT